MEYNKLTPKKSILIIEFITAVIPMPYSFIHLFICPVDQYTLILDVIDKGKIQ
jgi:hypothetical protein